MGLSDGQTMGLFLLLVFCQLRLQFCRAAYFHSALNFGFVPGESCRYCSKCNFNRLMPQELLSEVLKTGFACYRSNFCFFRTHLLDGDCQCPVSWWLCFPKHISSCQQGKSDSAWLHYQLKLLSLWHLQHIQQMQNRHQGCYLLQQVPITEA